MANICIYCQKENKELEPQEVAEHLTQLLMDTAMLEAMVMIHGKERGPQRYADLGGRIHLNLMEMEKQLNA